MVSYVSAESLILGAAGALVAYEVGPGAADAGRASSLVGIDHDVVLGGSLDDMLIVIVHKLAVVIFAARDDVADISRLDSVVAILVHQAEGILHVALVVESG